MQRSPGCFWHALIAPNALNATLSRQDPVNIVERLHAFNSKGIQTNWQVESVEASEMVLDANEAVN